MWHRLIISAAVLSVIVGAMFKFRAWRNRTRFEAGLHVMLLPFEEDWILSIPRSGWGQGDEAFIYRSGWDRSTHYRGYSAEWIDWVGTFGIEGKAFAELLRRHKPGFGNRNSLMFEIVLQTRDDRCPGDLQDRVWRHKKYIGEVFFGGGALPLIVLGVRRIGRRHGGVKPIR